MSNEELITMIQDGQEDKTAELWAQVEAFVKKQANKWTGYAEFEDLVQQGFLYFLDAVNSYEEGKGAKFLTWLAHWLSWGWQRWLCDNMAGFHIPAGIADRMLQYDKVRKEWTAKTGTQPTAEQLCYLMKCSRHELQTVKETIRRVNMRSLQERTETAGGDGLELSELIADDKDFTEDILDNVQREQLAAILWPLVDDLEGRQGEVLRQRYEQGRTIKETGEAMGVSSERIRQVEAKGLQMLRRPKNRKKLQAFYEGVVRSRAMVGTGVACFMRTWTSSTEREALRNLEI